MNITTDGTVWEHGRFDARRGAGKILFGRMYEDARIETSAFISGRRIFCIASAGCTALALAAAHEVVAVDINGVQLAYAERRLAGGSATMGAAESFMAFGRCFSPLVGWWPQRVRSFLDFKDPVEQIAYWGEHLDTRRFRAAVDGLLSLTALRTTYAAPFLDFLPAHLGAVMRARMARCFVRHPNRENPYARALLLGELPEPLESPEAKNVQWEHADAARFLELQPAGSFDGFALSNILDGANDAYRRRLYAAVRRAATPNAMVVQRSFREPLRHCPNNHAANDRAMLWGVVDVRLAAHLN